MKKSEQNLLAATLDKALQPPTKKRALATDLGEYDDQIEKTPVVVSETATRPTSRGVTPPNPTIPIAPERNYNKRANSLDKLALPAGLFPGSSQKLYNALYVRTRGAIVPLKTIRATKRELSDWSGIRNVKTIDSHLRYFSALGLIISHWERGQNDGALYEVNLPEETTGLNLTKTVSLGVTPPDPTLPHVPPPGVETGQISELPRHQNTGSPHHTQVLVDSATSSDAKTFSKTSERANDDDEAYAPLVSALKKATEEISGRPSSPAEAARWEELANVLVAELKIAAARTSVSSVPSFLAEHLRRRLWKVDKRQARAEGRELPDEALKTTPNIDASKCPDCSGSGWHYPEGMEKGVKKCAHEKLKMPERESK
ncbi:MAG: hypothetical protein WBP93_05060 [Pyrinomonadaceae bacterium]